MKVKKHDRFCKKKYNSKVHHYFFFNFAIVFVTIHLSLKQLTSDFQVTKQIKALK